MPENISNQNAGPKKNILLLEDEGSVSICIKTFLQAHGFAVDCVTNGVDGLKSIMAQDYDVVICDMMMPTLPGDMFYIAVERIKPKLCKRFVFISGYKGETKIDTFIKKIGGILLGKPFQMADLLKTIQLVMNANKV
jgi:two-component system, NtrC family, sensor kinase